MSLRFIYNPKAQPEAAEGRKPAQARWLDIGIGLAIGAAVAYFCIF
ncbi:MAG: hypothetical protein QM667_01495 [Asticcacaulis sp.]